LDEIENTYQSIADLGVKLKAVREENSRHGQVIYLLVTVTELLPASTFYHVQCITLSVSHYLLSDDDDDDELYLQPSSSSWHL